MFVDKNSARDGESEKLLEGNGRQSAQYVCLYHASHAHSLSLMPSIMISWATEKLSRPVWASIEALLGMLPGRTLKTTRCWACAALWSVACQFLEPLVGMSKSTESERALCSHGLSCRRRNPWQNHTILVHLASSRHREPCTSSVVAKRAK